MLWLGFALIAAVPMYLAVPEITVTDAYFEAWYQSLCDALSQYEG